VRAGRADRFTAGSPGPPWQPQAKEFGGGDSAISDDNSPLCRPPRWVGCRAADWAKSG